MSRAPYPMLSGGPVFRPRDVLVFLKRVHLRFVAPPRVDFTDNLKDRALPFDEYPPCELCGATEATEVVVAADGNRIVECASCGLRYTSPRPAEAAWAEWLSREDESRNIEFTENRLRHGMALSRNIPYAFSFWWRRTRRHLRGLIRRLAAAHGGGARSLHDVGCGVGFLVRSAQDLGLCASGNDLNAYAVRRMREALSLDVHLGGLREILAAGILAPASRDIVTMNDVIEHCYHPLAEVSAARDLLAPGGVLYLRTFCTGTARERRLGSRWDMFFWNHCFHFSRETLPALVARAGLEVTAVAVREEAGIIEVIARKPVSVAIPAS